MKAPLPRPICGPGLLIVFWMVSPARAQQSNPDALLPPNSVSLGSLQERRPGRLVQDAVNTHREFSNRAFGGRQGTPSAEDAADANFYDTVLLEVLNLVIERIQLALFGSQLLGSLDGLFGTDDMADDAMDEMSSSDEMSSPDDTSDDAMRSRGSASANEDALLDAFRARTSAR